jgi:hypothetical protein
MYEARLNDSHVDPMVAAKGGQIVFVSYFITETTLLFPSSAVHEPHTPPTMMIRHSYTWLYVKFQHDLAQLHASPIFSSNTYEDWSREVVLTACPFVLQASLPRLVELYP